MQSHISALVASLVVGTASLVVAGCAADGQSATNPGELDQQGAPAGDDAGAPPADDAARPPARDAGSDAAGAADNAEIVSATLPDALQCGEKRTVTIALRNTGSAAWTNPAYKLGAVGDSDPFSTATRIDLAGGESVAKAAVKSFTFDLKAPNAAGSYTTDWQMVHDGAGFFGAVASHKVAVTCPPPDPEASLASAGIYNSPPDIASWPVTTKITHLEITKDGVRVDFGKKDGPDRWPDVTPPGWDGPIQYTLWLLMNVNGKWAASGIIQFWYGLDVSGGDVTASNQIAVNWVYDGRWGPMAGHQPAPGEYVGFMVMAGNARGVTDASQAPARERSNAVMIPFPATAGATFDF